MTEPINDPATEFSASIEQAAQAAFPLAVGMWVESPEGRIGQIISLGAVVGVVELSDRSIRPYSRRKIREMVFAFLRIPADIMNEQVVYHRNHGTRAYRIVGQYDQDHVTVQPLSGGVEWTHHKDLFTNERPNG